MTTTVSATQGSVAVGSIQVGGNVNGDIIIGNHNFKVNTNYGTIVYNAASEPVIKRRDAKPQPPRAPLDFFDRTGELAQVEQLITQGKPVAICGSDGAGKSALLRQAANSNTAHALPDGAILLEGLDEQGNTLLPGDVIQRWFDAFYLSEPPLKVTSASAQPYLSQLRPLVLLDNIALDADQLRPLLDLFPNSPALIARPSALPGLARPIKLGALPRGDALELFAATSGLLIDDGNRVSVDAICALLNDVPLAIVRAADVIREMNLPLDQAQKRLAAASSATGDNIAQGLSHAAILIQSVLTPLEKEVLEVAANLPGISIDPQKIAGILSAGDPSGVAATYDPASVEAAVEHLKALGLLHANSPRVRLDAGLREFWQGQGGNAIKDRLLAQLLRDQKDGRFGDDEYCANELGHVLGAIDHAVQTQQWSAAITLSRAIDRYVTLHGLWDVWGQIADRVLQSARAAGDRSAEAWALHQLGTRAIGSDKTQAINLLKQALSVRQALGETTAAAYTQHNLDILIPPPIPPKGNAGSIGPAGLSGAAKFVIGAVLVGLIAVGAIVVAQLSAQTPTPMVVVLPDTPTHQPSHTPTKRPSRTPTATRTPTGTLPPTKTFTPTPTDTPTPAALIPYLEQVGNAYEIFVSNEDGSQRTQLTEQSATGNFDPVLSPDGKAVAYWSFGPVAVARVPARQLFVMNLADRQPHRLLSGQPYQNHTDIVWSLQNDQVAVTLANNDFPVSLIDTVPIDGGGAQRLNPPREIDMLAYTDPSFSPDGSQAAFMAHAVQGSEGYHGFVVVNSDGSRRRDEVAKSIMLDGFANGQLAWSPTGDQIAFSGLECAALDGCEGVRTAVYLINADGGDLKPLTKAMFGPLTHLAWSPDGQHLAFIADNTLWMMSAPRFAPQVISRGLSAEPTGCTFVPWFVWLPGSQRLAYNTDRNGSIEIHTISLDGRDDTTLKTAPPSYLRLPRGC